LRRAAAQPAHLAELDPASSHLPASRASCSSVGLISRRCPICANTRPWLCSSSSSTLCCRFDCHHCCMPRCVPAECRLLYPSTCACPWLALALARLLVFTAAHLLFVHQISVCSHLPSSHRTRHPLLDSQAYPLICVLLAVDSQHHVLTFPCAHLCRPCLITRVRYRSRRVSCILKKYTASSEDEASSVIFTKCSTKSSNKSSIVILVNAKIRED
jgi:hypothetical protein